MVAESQSLEPFSIPFRVHVLWWCLLSDLVCSNGTLRKNVRYEKNWPENPNGEGLADFSDGGSDDSPPPELPSCPPPSFPLRTDWDGGSLYSNEAGSYFGNNTPSESMSLNSESVSSVDRFGFDSNYNTNRQDLRYVPQCVSCACLPPLLRRIFNLFLLKSLASMWQHCCISTECPWTR